MGRVGHGLARRVAAVVAAHALLLAFLWHHSRRGPPPSVADGPGGDGAASCRCRAEAVLDGILLPDFWETVSLMLFTIKQQNCEHALELGESLACAYPDCRGAHGQAHRPRQEDRI